MHKSVDRMERFIKNRHTNETVVIIANGPSLNQTNFDLIRERKTIGVNKIYLGFTSFRFYPSYYVGVNEKVLRQSTQQIASLNCVKFLSDRAPDLFQDDALTYVLRSHDTGMGFSKEISKAIHEGWTVTYAALQIAYYMGFTKVVIVGLDHRFEYQGSPNEVHLMRGPDPNHFSSKYFANQEWDNPDLEHSDSSFQLAREVFEAENRVILDATVSGNCKIFEKRPLELCFA